MTEPKKLLLIGAVAKRYGKTEAAAKSARQRASESSWLPDPHYILVANEEDEHDGRVIYAWDPDRLPADHPDVPALLGDGGEALPDDFMIGPRMWAALQMAAESTVLGNHSAAARRRAEGKPEPWDMPPEVLTQGRSPRWRMGQYRAWEQAQDELARQHPGVFANANRPRR